MTKVLIQGHPEKFDNHWMKSLIEERSRLDYPQKTVQYETADIKSGGTHVIDAFHPDTTFHNSFDTLWLPDLGGEWWVKQRDSGIPIRRRAGHLLLSIEAASMVVKPGGHVYVFKFIPQEEYSSKALVQQIIKFSEQKKSFASAEMISFDPASIPGIHFVKHAVSTSAVSKHSAETLRLRINMG